MENEFSELLGEAPDLLGDVLNQRKVLKIMLETYYKLVLCYQTVTILIEHLETFPNSLLVARLHNQILRFLHAMAKFGKVNFSYLDLV